MKTISNARLRRLSYVERFEALVLLLTQRRPSFAKKGGELAVAPSGEKVALEKKSPNYDFVRQLS